MHATVREPTPLELLHAIQKLDVKPGDVLLVTLGDPQIGWIPGAEHERRMRAQLKEALPPGVTVATFTYDAVARTLRELESPTAERTASLEAIAAVTFRGTLLHRLLAALAGGPGQLAHLHIELCPDDAFLVFRDVVSNACAATWVTPGVTEAGISLVPGTTVEITDLGRAVLAAAG